MAALRNLKIKTSSTCRRIVKELHSYEKEENMLAESRLMIPDCHKRLEDALGDLKGTLVELEESGHKDGLEAMMLEAS